MLAVIPTAAGAQAVGSEFQVNTYTTGKQWSLTLGHHLAAADASGNFVVVWSGQGPDEYYGIFGQRYDSSGVPLGLEFRANSYTGLWRNLPAVASDPSGNFVVVWDSYQQDGSSWGVFGQRFDSEGTPWGSEFRVNSYTTGRQLNASVASDANGNFVVVWDHYLGNGSAGAIFGQRYDSSGAALGSEFRVNSSTFDSRNSSLASDADGDFVVVWQSHPYGQAYDIFGQRFDKSGVRRGDEFRVNSYQPSQHWNASLASDAIGNFVVVWEAGVGGTYDVIGQRFDSDGQRRGAEFQANSGTPELRAHLSVASDDNGSFVVAWGSGGQQGYYWGVFGQRYDSSGTRQGDEFQISPYTTSVQNFPSVQATGANQFVVVWTDFADHDGSSYGVFGQRYDFANDTTPPNVTITAPNGGEKLFTGSSYVIRWLASDDAALSDVSVSIDGGTSYTPIAECQGLPATARKCLWLVPAPPSGSALIRVTAEDTSGNSGSDDSDGAFTIVAGTAVVTVTSPNTNVRWRIGSLQKIQWTHNLGLNSTFRIELDRNNDGVYEQPIAAAAPAVSATKGSFNWTVSGPASNVARVRVSWTGNPGVSDASNTTFQIRPAN